MSYKDLVKQIRDLRWENLDEKDLQRLMILSGYSAREFGDSLRTTLRVHPNNPALEEMASQELNTDNLSYDDYNRSGDHADFLWHFIAKHGILQHNLVTIGSSYIRKVDGLSDEVKVMSIVSREQELPGIFQRILTAPKWKAPGLPEFEYYLKTHIALDSAEGGHADMLKGFVVDDRVTPFYEARLDMYRALPKLFEK